MPNVFACASSCDLLQGIAQQAGWLVAAALIAILPHSTGLRADSATRPNVEETFPLNRRIEDRFIDGGSDRVDGWISHYFGYTIEEHLCGAEPVTLSEVRPDVQEMLVQSGWLRASHRALDGMASTPLRPRHLHMAESVEKLVPGKWTGLRIELFPFAHVFRDGSRIRLIVSGPGGAGNAWPWAFDALPGGFDVRIAHDGQQRASSLGCAASRAAEGPERARIAAGVRPCLASAVSAPSLNGCNG